MSGAGVRYTDTVRLQRPILMPVSHAGVGIALRRATTGCDRSELIVRFLAYKPPYRRSTKRSPQFICSPDAGSIKTPCVPVPAMYQY